MLNKKNILLFSISIFGFLLILLIILLLQLKKEPALKGDNINMEAAAISSDYKIEETNNAFSLEIFSYYFNKNKDQNIFFSPFSLHIALSMLYEGAANNTAKELAEVLKLPSDIVALRSKFSNDLELYSQEGEGMQIKTVNDIWPEKTYPILSNYINVLQNYYNANLESLDYLNQAEKSRLIINDYIFRQTNEKIKDLIPQSLINNQTRLVLTNAIYFKAKWLYQFKEYMTRKEDFTLASGDLVVVDMMSINKNFDYFRDDNWQVVALPYKNTNIRLLLVLNDNENNELNLGTLNLWRSSLKKTNTLVYLPKFEFEEKYFMKEDFREIGLNDVFGAKADFSRINKEKDIFVSDIIHQANISIDEVGTEASAATAIIMESFSTGEEPKYEIFKANRPFYFLIEDTSNNNILFLGYLNNPS